MKLTGKIRYRSLKLPFLKLKLVLQVQYSTTDVYYDYVYIHSNKRLEWRDASVEDLAELNNYKLV